MSRAPVAEAAQQARQTAQRPRVEWVLRQGWLAKGLVYVLMGWVAMSFVLAPAPTDDQASPEGALGVVADRTGGRVLLAVLGVGLVLYVVWRIVTVLDVRGHDAKAVLERIGYGASAVFYTFLAFTAFRNALAGTPPDDSFSVERMSAALLRHTWGRTLLFVVAAVVVVVAMVFAYRALTAKFTEGIDGLAPRFAANHGRSRALYVLGMAGWIGRAVVVGMIGFFVGLAALHHDAKEASGFDHSLRRAAKDPVGQWFVVVAAIGLILYGAYCAISSPRRNVEQKSS